MKRTPLVRHVPLRRRRTGTIRGRRRKNRRTRTLWCSWGHWVSRLVVIVAPDETYCRSHGARIADGIVGRVVKVRDGRCVACGSGRSIEELEWAHVHVRGARYIRWDPENAVALCHGCHAWYGEHPRDWRAFIERRSPGLWTRLVHREIAGERSGASIDVAEVIRRFRVAAA